MQHKEHERVWVLCENLCTLCGKFSAPANAQFVQKITPYLLI